MAPYTWETTGEEIASDLSAAIKGKTVLITGVSPNSLGASFATTIAKHAPALIILAGRDLAKSEQTAKSIAEITAAAASAVPVPVRLLKLDLASQTQIREAAREVNNYREKYIDVLVNNAGIMAAPYSLTEEGIESQFGLNHVGHFLFTNLIMQKLIPSSSSEGRTVRVVNVSSNGYRLSPVRFEDWNFGVRLKTLRKRQRKGKGGKNGRLTAQIEWQVLQPVDSIRPVQIGKYAIFQITGRETRWPGTYLCVPSSGHHMDNESIQWCEQ